MKASRLKTKIDLNESGVDILNTTEDNVSVNLDTSQICNTRRRSARLKATPIPLNSSAVDNTTATGKRKIETHEENADVVDSGPAAKKKSRKRANKENNSENIMDKSVEVIEKSLELLELPTTPKDESVKRNLSDVFSSAEKIPCSKNKPSFAEILKQQNSLSKMTQSPKWSFQKDNSNVPKPPLKRDLSFVLENCPAMGRNSSTPKKSETNTVSLRKATPVVTKNHSVKKGDGSISRSSKKPLETITKMISNSPNLSSRQIIHDTLQVNDRNSPIAIIKSIRKIKRSISVDDATIEKKNVTFHSPANMEMSVYDIDIKMLSEVKKSGKRIRSQSQSCLEEPEQRNTTSTVFIEETPGKHEPVIKTMAVTPSSRTKMPNFAEIHRKQFEKMESIVEHSSRIADRAKTLAMGKSPAVSLHNTSAKRNDINVGVVKPTLSKIPIASHNSSSGIRPPTPTKQLHFVSRPQTPSKQLPSTVVPRTQTPSKILSTSSASRPQTPSKGVLSTIVPRTQTPSKKCAPSTSATTKSQTPVKCLNTSISTQTIGRPGVFVFGSTITNPKITASVPGEHVTIRDKVKERHQKNIALYKSRTDVKDKQNSGMLKGVRTNRRFDLQMKFRKMNESNYL